MTTHPPDPRVERARALSWELVARDLGLKLRREGRWLVGPCPVCGGAEKRDADRFSIEPQRGGFSCRKCSATGGDVIALAMAARDCDFRAALDWMVGPPEARAKTPAEKEAERREAERLAAAREAREREDREAAEAYRRRAIEAAARIWKASRVAAPDGPVGQYLRARGIGPERIGGMPADLRYLPEHAYQVSRGGQRITPYTGPAMIAAVRGPSGKGICVHQTWFDPERPGKKPVIEIDGEVQRNKLTRGSQRRGAIRLITPQRFETMVMGEGIETTLTAAASGRAAGAAFWAGISLGHMGGKMRKVPGVRYSGLPDMTDEDGFVPPPCVRNLVLIEDGDSDFAATRAKLQSCARRAMALRAGLRAWIVRAGDGVDLNDLVQGRAEVEAE
jgi:hypothetical protein